VCTAVVIVVVAGCHAFGFCETKGNTAQRSKTFVQTNPNSNGEDFT